MIKSNYKNVLNDIKSHKKKHLENKKHSQRYKKRLSPKIQASSKSAKRYKDLKAENKMLKKKYADLEIKYMETHNDLLRSKTSLQIEVIKENKKSNRSIQSSKTSSKADSLRIINETQRDIGSFNNSQSSKNKKIQNTNDILTENGSSKCTIKIKSSNNNSLKQGVINISELHNLAIEEVYATNSSLNIYKTNSNLKDLFKKNKELAYQVQKYKEAFASLKKLNSNKSYHTKICETESRIEKIRLSIGKIKNMIPSKSVEESFNLVEIELGEPLSKPLVNPNNENIKRELSDLKQKYEIEKKNNSSLRLNFREKEDEIESLQTELQKKRELKTENVSDEGLISKNTELEERIEAVEKKKKDMEDQLVDIRNRYRTTFKSMTSMKKEMSNIQKNSDTLVETVENLRETLEEKSKEVGELEKMKDNPSANKKLQEDYEKDLTTGNKENERLNSILEEKKVECEHLQIDLKEMKEKQVKLVQENQQLMIKLNVIISSQLDNNNNESNQKFIDAFVGDPRVTEFGTQGGLRSFSFKNILTRGLKEGLFGTNQTLDNANSFLADSEQCRDNMDFINIEGITSKQSSFQESKQKEQDNSNMLEGGLKKSMSEQSKPDKVMTINFNTYRIDNVNVVNNTQIKNGFSEPKQDSIKQKEASFNNSEKEASFLSEETNVVPSKKIDFKSQLSNSFDLGSESNKNKDSNPNNNININKPARSQTVKTESDIPKLYMDVNIQFSDEDSSANSIMKPSPKNSKDSKSDNKHALSDNILKNLNVPRKSHMNVSNKKKTVSRKESNNSSGNLIRTSPCESIHSVENSTTTAERQKKKHNHSAGRPLHKSLFQEKKSDDSQASSKKDYSPKTLGNNNNNSFNFQNADPTKNFEESEDEFFFGSKKQIDSGVFSNRVINAFEEDENIDKMMADEDVGVGTTAIEYSQRFVAIGTEEVKVMKEQEMKAKSLQGGRSSEITEQDRDANLFDQSIGMVDSFAFGSNTSDINNLSVHQHGKILNQNNSFAANPMDFVSGSSFGTGGNMLNNIFENVKKQHEDVMVSDMSKSKETYESKSRKHSKPQDLTIVPEENGNKDQLEDIFEIKIKNDHGEEILDFKIKSDRGEEIVDFNSIDSLAGMGDHLISLKMNNPSYKETDNLGDLMLDFNTGALDQKFFDDIQKLKKSKEQLENDGVVKSLNTSLDDGMFFDNKKIENDDEPSNQGASESEDDENLFEKD